MLSPGGAQAPRLLRVPLPVLSVPTAIPRSNRPLVLWMIAAVVGVGSLAYWDDARESAAVLEEFGQEQATLADTVAVSLATRLEDVRRDALVFADDAANGRRTSAQLSNDYLDVKVVDASAPPPSEPADGQGFALSVPAHEGRRVQLVVSASELFAGLGRSQRPNAVTVLILPPRADHFLTPDGRTLKHAAVLDALKDGGSTLTVPKEEAGRLGLPPRMARVGLARVDAGPLGRWGVAVAATASRERDRERRDRLRLVLSIALAAGLVLAFGGFALRKQRQELELARGLEEAEAARQREERLERESRAATMLTLASGVAHELSTPLGVIAGRAEQLAARAPDDERTQRSAGVILAQVEHVSRVLRGLLGLARGGTPSLEEVPPAAVVRGALALVEHRFAQAEVSLTPEVAEPLPGLRCDRRLLEHALVNLLLNACDASPRGGTVRVEAQRDGDELAFAVTDAGAGIPAADIARATEPFFTTKPSGKGSGLGLAIVNEIAKSHRGSLTLGPSAPHGTRACIRIPLEPGVESPGVESPGVESPGVESGVAHARV